MERKAGTVFARRARAQGDGVNMLRKLLSAAVIGAGVVLASTFGASAAIVCQGHTCWHAHEAYVFLTKPASSFMTTIGTGVRTKSSLSVSTKAAATGAAANG